MMVDAVTNNAYRARLFPRLEIGPWTFTLRPDWTIVGSRPQAAVNCLCPLNRVTSFSSAVRNDASHSPTPKME